MSKARIGKNARQRRADAPLARRQLNDLLDHLAGRVAEPVAVANAIASTLTRAGLDLDPARIDPDHATVALQAMRRLTGLVEGIARTVTYLADHANGRPA